MLPLELLLILYRNLQSQLFQFVYLKNSEQVLRFGWQNTEKNIRDRDSMTKTPLDQSESEADRMITQKIRKAVMADSALSTNAKNIKNITIKGMVKLRGPVASSQEKDAIVEKLIMSKE